MADVFSTNTWALAHILTTFYYSSAADRGGGPQTTHGRPWHPRQPGGKVHIHNQGFDLLNG